MTIKMQSVKIEKYSVSTGVARNFDWGAQIGKFFVTFFGDVMVMTSLK